MTDLKVVRDAFRWRGGSELMIELTIDRGRPAELTEIIYAYQVVCWIAAVAEALANYGAWIVRGKPSHPKFSEFHEWVKGLPDPATLRDPLDVDGRVSLQRLNPWRPFFNTDDTFNQLVELVGMPTEIDRSLIGPTDLALSLQLLSAIQENPTRSTIKILGGLLALSIASSAYATVSIKQTVGADRCHELVHAGYVENYGRTMDLIYSHGKTTSEDVELVRELNKATTAADQACAAVSPTMEVSVWGGLVKTTIGPAPSRHTEEEAARKGTEAGTETSKDSPGKSRGR
jgi:hypothetical protein